MTSHLPAIQEETVETSTIPSHELVGEISKNHSLAGGENNFSLAEENGTTAMVEEADGTCPATGAGTVGGCNACSGASMTAVPVRRGGAHSGRALASAYALRDYGGTSRRS